MRAAELDDADDVRPVRIPLSVNDPNAGRSLTRSVERILRDGRTSAPVLVELHGNHLPAPLIAVLIGNLRRMREVGGAFAVTATASEVRSAIALHGLDRILGHTGRPGDDMRRQRNDAAETAWPVAALLVLTITVAAVAILIQTTPGLWGI